MIKRWFVSFLLLLSLVGISRAQDAAQPLILIKAGDLWEWTGGPMLRQKTQWGYNGGLVMSPLNNEIAYSSVSAAAVENGAPGAGGSPATNIWVITTDASDTAYRPADQPVGAAELIRSRPMWSPDGTQIAWTEIGVGDQSAGTYTLVVYDKITQTSRQIASGLPAQFGHGATLDGVWTDRGIVLFSRTYNPDSVNGSVSYMLFDPATGEKKFDFVAVTIQVKDDRLEPRQALPIQYQDKTWLGVLYTAKQAAARWQMIDLDTGQFAGETANIIGFAPGHAETSLRVIPVVSNNIAFPHYVIQQANGAVLNLSNDPNRIVERFALSPDGQAVVYQLFDYVTNKFDSAIYVWRNGVITLVPQTEYPAIISELVWGDITWEIGGEGPGIGALGS